ncbi:unnamed protein product [Arctogadus glacialis]
MAEVIYAMPNMMTKARYTQGEREERIVAIYASLESLRDQQQHSVGTEESSKSLGTGRSQRPDAQRMRPLKGCGWVDGTVLSLDDPAWSGGEPDGALLVSPDMFHGVQAQTLNLQTPDLQR